MFLIDVFNAACNNISTSYLKVGVDLEPLWTEFNTVTCSVTGALILIEVHIVKEGVNNSKYHMQLGDAAACTKIMMEATNGICQRSIKRGYQGFYVFDSWFSSNNSSESAVYVGTDLICMVKTNTLSFNSKSSFLKLLCTLTRLY